eukprot:CAMPEP_0172187524 /NCGR_PEP_ID=MMETSP1050-20130122/21393_1 /TAXON_ID=233186 /ORGANISM="Cryptomonas curvata, Strain CCAP979/52" /LENGTH=131 /DNA_ID=CAMNT_0012861871 /DNA_START=81 /DNA_END=477 /DNA_ORIENTATION=-
MAPHRALPPPRRPTADGWCRGRVWVVCGERRALRAVAGFLLGFAGTIERSRVYEFEGADIDLFEFRMTVAKAAAAPKKAAPKKAGGAKKPTPYNAFMKEELARLKKDNPKLDHKEAFKQAAGNWTKNKPKD